MKFSSILFILILFLLLRFAVAENASFRMLKSNLISGLIPDIEDGYGVAFRDFNQDGLPDIYLVCFRSLNRLLINNGGIVPFIDRTIYSGLGGNLMPRGQSNLELGASAADYDNDGLPDIFLAGWGKAHKLFRNDGNLKFTDETSKLNLHGLLDANQGLWLDANSDGNLDLYITDEHHSNRLFVNNGDGTFAERIWSLNVVDSAVSQGACSADFDQDGDADIYVANWFAPDYLLLNDGQGNFKQVALPLTTLRQKISTNSAVCADLDNDGLPELLVAAREGRVFVYRNQSSGGQLHLTEEDDFPFRNLQHSVYGIVPADFNQDGWTDLFFAVKGQNYLYLNDGAGGFSPQYDTDGRHSYSTGCAAADFDRDGDLDILVANKDALSQVYLNPTNNKHFIAVTVRGVRSNRDGIGTKIYCYSADSTHTLLGFREVQSSIGYLSSGPAEAHFGTGYVQTVTLTLRFPSGRVVTSGPLAAGRRYTISEYGVLYTALYSSYRFVLFHVTNPYFWLNVALILLLLILIAGFLRNGIKRYNWQATDVATIMVIWFVLMVFAFLAFRRMSMPATLFAVNLISLLDITFTVFYSERQRRMRLQHARFRRALRELSGKMIMLYDENQVFSELIAAIATHEEIRAVIYLRYDAGHNKLYIRDGRADNQTIELAGGQIALLLQHDWSQAGRDKPLQPLFETLSVNHLLTIKQGQTLLGVVALQIQAANKNLLREDIQALLPICHQTAIALQNINFIHEREELVRQLTEARVKEKYLKQLEETNRRLDEKNSELTRLFEELKQKESQLIQSEKMAALGHLVAGISHELNNPISFIYANTKELEGYLRELKALWQKIGEEAKAPWQHRFQTIIEDLESIIHDNLNGSQSVKELVQNLKNFSRLDQAQWKEAHVVEGLESSLKILKPQFTPEIHIVKDYAADPPVYCNPGQLNQVFVNLLSNALQAIGERGTITIRTRQEKADLLISIHDDGKGIPPEIISKIFDPFFTTKDVNKGTGLGLSISYQIIEKHRGTIFVDSAPGAGTTFTIRLPVSARSK